MKLYRAITLGCCLVAAALAVAVQPAEAQRRPAPFASLSSAPAAASGARAVPVLVFALDTIPGDSSAPRSSGEHLPLRTVLGATGMVGGGTVGAIFAVLVSNPGSGEWSGVMEAAIGGFVGGIVGTGLGAALPRSDGRCRRFGQRARRAVLGAAAGTAAGITLLAATNLVIGSPPGELWFAIPLGALAGSVAGAEC